ncbi:hypothetical protein BASA81_011287 [Batrachochytrium salamandrivorans]|nr:hypothetical protein BASA81_011287 [Batrachochytrium salamandrivorans]
MWWLPALVAAMVAVGLAFRGQISLLLPPQPPSSSFSEQPQPPADSAMPSRSALYPNNLEFNNPEVNEIGQRVIDNSKQVAFSLHFNGDGLGQGLSLNTKDFVDVDDIITKHCCALGNFPPERCQANSGSRLVNDAGVRLLSFNDLDEANPQRVYCIPNALHFVWPRHRTGHVIFPKNVRPASKDLGPIKLVQLSENVRVFSVENFVSQAEITELLENNQQRMTPSEVGFGGWQDSTRTSSTSWDFTSEAALAIQKRTFQILGMDYEPEIADAMQVLQYEPGKWYKPHVDWFSKTGFDGSVPEENNGTNRFATMFLYLSTVPEGGHTVFPLSTTHEGYNGEKLVHDGTVNVPGYIKTEEAVYCCSNKSTALKGKPVAGNAVLFYGQGPDGTLDPYSLHGGCPPLVGDKWSANVWIWNRKRPDKSMAKDKRVESKNTLSVPVAFHNHLSERIELFWDANAPNKGLDDLAAFTKAFATQKNRFKPQGWLEAEGGGMDLKSFEGHVFVAVDPAQQVRWVGTVPAKSAETHQFKVI